MHPLLQQPLDFLLPEFSRDGIVFKGNFLSCQETRTNEIKNTQKLYLPLYWLITTHLALPEPPGHLPAPLGCLECLDVAVTMQSPEPSLIPLPPASPGPSETLIWPWVSLLCPQPPLLPTSSLSPHPLRWDSGHCRPQHAGASTGKAVGCPSVLGFPEPCLLHLHLTSADLRSQSWDRCQVGLRHEKQPGVPETKQPPHTHTHTTHICPFCWDTGLLPDSGSEEMAKERPWHPA